MLPLGEQMFMFPECRAHRPTHPRAYEVYVYQRLAEDSQGSETQQVFDASDLESVFFIPQH